MAKEKIIVNRPKGTQDVVPADAYKWQTVERRAAETAERYGFGEIRFPTFENTALFKRSAGDTADVVQKEMYSVTAKNPAEDKEPNDFALRPEGTAGAARAVIENGLLNEALPQKVYYSISCFRHENTQAGRLREFHQFGAEMYGSPFPEADAEIIALADSVVKKLKPANAELSVNSIGCPKCREKYREALKNYFEDKKSGLCPTCLERLERNPMRILDCKSPICQEIAKDAPVILDFLCEECSEHFEKLKLYLNDMEIAFSVDPKIVRGLDYYTKTVFEISADAVDKNGKLIRTVICGGGRYDGLIEQLGGKPVPALGFAMGIERLIMAMEYAGAEFVPAEKCGIYIAAMGEKAKRKAVVMTKRLRDAGYRAEFDTMERDIKPQMRYADKIGARLAAVIGDNELESGTVKLKNMSSGEQFDIALDGKFTENFSEIYNV